MSTLRYVVVPDPIDLAGKSYAFGEFVRHLVETDARFNSSGPGVRASLRVEKIFAVAGPGDTATLSEADHGLLHGAAETPSHGYPELQALDANGNLLRRVPIARSLLPFLDAIKDAPTEPPKRSETQ